MQLEGRRQACNEIKFLILPPALPWPHLQINQPSTFVAVRNRNRHYTSHISDTSTSASQSATEKLTNMIKTHVPYICGCDLSGDIHLSPDRCLCNKMSLQTVPQWFYCVRIMVRQSLDDLRRWPDLPAYTERIDSVHLDVREATQAAFFVVRERASRDYRLQSRREQMEEIEVVF